VIQKVGRRGIRKPRTRFFTTNYDLCFEEAARCHRFTIIDGFSHALDQVYDRAHFDHDIVRREQGKDSPATSRMSFTFTSYTWLDRLAADQQRDSSLPGLQG
jgi:hypothetical protein